MRWNLLGNLFVLLILLFGLLALFYLQEPKIIVQEKVNDYTENQLLENAEIIVKGIVKDYVGDKPIANAEIIVYEDDEEVDNQKTNQEGFYILDLYYDKFYRIEYHYSSFITKFITIDTRSIPANDREGGYEMYVDMTVFKSIGGMDISLFERPIGKAKYDSIRAEIVWDIDYTNNLQEKIKSLLKPYKEELNADNY